MDDFPLTDSRYRTGIDFFSERLNEILDIELKEEGKTIDIKKMKSYIKVLRLECLGEL